MVVAAAASLGNNLSPPPWISDTSFQAGPVNDEPQDEPDVLLAEKDTGATPGAAPGDLPVFPTTAVHDLALVELYDEDPLDASALELHFDALDDAIADGRALAVSD